MAEEKGQAKHSKWTLLLSIFLFAALISSYFIFPDFQDFIYEGWRLLKGGDKQKISEWVKGFGLWGPIFIIIAMILQMFVFVIPSPLLMVVSVVAYGAVLGALTSVLAVGAASSIGYAIGRYLSQTTVDKLLDPKKQKKISYYIERYGYWTIIIVRLSPLFSNDAISFIGGLMKMGYWKFIGATIIGIIPLAGLIGYFGENSDRFKTGMLWISLISMAAFIGYVIYDCKNKPGKNS